MRKSLIRLTENDLNRIVAESAMRVLREAIDPVAMNESHLYTNDINPDDLKVSGHWTEDGYAEWEAKVDNGWYTFRGTYDGFDCELDEIIEGHSGHGHQVDIDDEAIDWFNETIADKIKVWLNNYAEDFEDYHKRVYGEE